MARRAAARLAGISFEAQAPAVADSLPRMDVAVFVGFAASGPVGLPVAVEDAAQFAAIFGDDAPLAWDAERGEQIYAYLAPTVRAFFRNGGRRCWIVRVAGKQARYNYFPVPGLARLHPRRGVAPAGLKARAKGSWSDALRVGAVLLSQPVVVVAVTVDGGTVDSLPGPTRSIDAHVAIDPSRDLVVGDLVRVSFSPDCVLMFGVDSIEAPDPALVQSPGDPGSPPGEDRGRNVLRVIGRAAVWFRPAVAPPPIKWGRARFFAPDGRRRRAAAAAAGDPRLNWTAGQPVALDLEIAPAESPPAGSLMRVDFGTEQLWLTVGDVRIASRDPSSSRETVRVVGNGLWWMKQPPYPLPTVSFGAPPRIADRLRLELRVRRGDEAPIRMGDLGFEPQHQRFWAGQVPDQRFYDPSAATGRDAASVAPADATRRSPLAGFESPAGFYFPIAMPIVSDDFVGRTGLQTTALERDGLAVFDETLFLDGQLSTVGMASLIGEADFIQYVRSDARRLSGIHASLPIDEATLVAVPDAVHRGWTPSTARDDDPPGPPTQPRRPEWWRALSCVSPLKVPTTIPTSREEFLDSRLRAIAPPSLTGVSAPDSAGTFTLAWSTREDEEYTLVESTTPQFDGAVPVYHGGGGRFVVYGRSPGHYYYWVRAEADGLTSDWSEGKAVHVRRATGWQVLPSTDYSDERLVSVQRALLRTAAARGDLLAVLTLPEHYREADAIAHIARLKAGSPRPGDDTAVRPLTGGESRAYSFGALYHPWIVIRDDSRDDELTRLPPDGAVTGMLAERAITRGAWIAPANELLRGVVALTPPLLRGWYLALQDAQLNVIRHQPQGFMPLSADTLGEDADLVPINVRRLLILLRRLALREGNAYVFEPNGARFRRLVQRGFEALLGQLFARGAFAGANPATAFQVVTDETVNTAASVEQGRLIVELRVAPAVPLTFLTVRLVQSGDRRLIAEER